MRTALLFAGQGAQTVGMGRDWIEAFPLARDLAESANTALGYDLARICLDGPDAELTRTENAQPGIFLVSWIAFELLRSQVSGLLFHATAGLSLGEFTALTAAGSLTFADGLRVTRLRGRFMQEACEATEGAMAAIINLDEAATREVCEEAGVELANLNCPGQLVISGAAKGIERACELAKARGAKRALPLPVAGAYHSKLMAGAQPKLAAELEALEIRTPAVPVISNVTANPHADPRSIRELLVRQVCAPVRWEDSVRWLLAAGVDRFVELGPGKALTGFLKRIAPQAQVFNVGDGASLEATVTAWTSA